MHWGNKECAWDEQKRLEGHKISPNHAFDAHYTKVGIKSLV
jgi:hypothetical protein